MKYGDVRLREEIEGSRYVFGQIDMPHEEFGAFHRDLFDRYFRLAEILLDPRSIQWLLGLGGIWLYFFFNQLRQRLVVVRPAAIFPRASPTGPTTAR